jgi:hypothetical protein
MLTLDEKLLNDALALAGPIGRNELVNAALRAFIQREAARQLAQMGGTEPQLKAIPRRRLKPA